MAGPTDGASGGDIAAIPDDDIPGVSESSPVPASNSGATTNNSARFGSSILSDKVARALEVRTDTPAMRAALDALANLPTQQSYGDHHHHTHPRGGGTGGSGGGGGGGIDARSVRVAIEQDALRQALLFESELRKLVETASKLRESVSAVREVAVRVSASIEADVVTAARVSGLQGEHQQGGGLEEKSQELTLSDGVGAGQAGGGRSSLEEEQHLASVLADAFRERDEAARRATIVQAFLDKFDLSEGDSYLLDHYNFEEFEASHDRAVRHQQGGQQYHRRGLPPPGKDDGQAEGMAFLDALERVRSIRIELGKTFGTTAPELLADSGGIFQSSSSLNSASSGADGSKAHHHLGATSAIRMMESLATKQERAYERLYHFLQRYLGLNNVAATAVSHVPTSSAALMQQEGRGTPFQQQQQHLHGDEDAMDEALTHPLVRRSLKVLRHVPAFHSHTLELVASSRRAEVTRRFLLALTSGYDGMSPIEMKAHDPVNYVGDMLAFVFRSTSVESDLARGLVEYRDESADDDDDGKDADNDDKDGSNKDAAPFPPPPPLGDEDDDEPATTADDDLLLHRPMSSTEILSHAMSGVARPLKSRISQVVSSLARRPDDDASSAVGGGSDMGVTAASLTGSPHHDEEEGSAARTRIASLYSICGLLLFYRSALEKAVLKLEQNREGSSRNLAFGGGSQTTENKTKKVDNPLLDAMRDCLNESTDAYAASVRVYGATLTHLASISSSNSETESTLANALLLRIAEVRVASPGFAADVVRPDEDPNSASTTTASLSLEFVCDTVIHSALPTCRSLDDAVTLRMAVSAAKKSGLSIDCAENWESIISQKEKDTVDELVDTESRKVLDKCGLGPLCTALERMEEVYVEGMTMSSHPGLTQRDAESAMKEFYSSLYSPPFPTFESIKDPVLRKYSRSKTAEKVAEAYRGLYDAITSDRGGYEDLAFLGHNPDQVATLLAL